MLTGLYLAGPALLPYHGALVQSLHIFALVRLAALVGALRALQGQIPGTTYPSWLNPSSLKVMHLIFVDFGHHGQLRALAYSLGAGVVYPVL